LSREDERARGVGDERVVGGALGAAGEARREERLSTNEGGDGVGPGERLTLKGAKGGAEEAATTDRFARVLEEVELWGTRVV
jgi:hypothetical protein